MQIRYQNLKLITKKQNHQLPSRFIRPPYKIRIGLIFPLELFQPFIKEIFLYQQILPLDPHLLHFAILFLSLSKKFQ